jgi:centractin
LVFDSGDGVSHAVPVYEGFAVNQAIQRIDIAGRYYLFAASHRIQSDNNNRDVTEYLQSLLRRSGNYFYTSAEKEIVRIIKEKTCFLSLNLAKEEKESLGKFEDFTLPDGKVIKLGNERFRAPEILFNPEIIGIESIGVQDIVHDGIQKVDMDLRKPLYENIVMSGGSTLTKGIVI